MAGVARRTPSTRPAGEHWQVSRSCSPQPMALRPSAAHPALLRHGLLDGAIRLQLVAQAGHKRSVLLPRKGAMPLLHQLVEGHGYAVEQQPAACQEPAAWLKRARDRRLAMPVCSELLGQRWLNSNRLELLAEQPPLSEQLWLLLPQRAAGSRAARLCLRRLRLQVTRLKTMQDRHGIQY